MTMEQVQSYQFLLDSAPPGKSCIVFSGLPGLGKTTVIRQLQKEIPWLLVMPKYHRLVDEGSQTVIRRIEYETQMLITVNMSARQPIIFDRIFLDELIYPTYFRRIGWQAIQIAAQQGMWAISPHAHFVHFTTDDYQGLSHLLKRRARNVTDECMTPGALEEIDKMYKATYTAYMDRRLSWELYRTTPGERE